MCTWTCFFWRFNPCCGGSVTQRVHEGKIKCFNPCCGGSVTGGVEFLVLRGLRIVFQSLLWWISYWRLNHYKPASGGYVSILVVVDQLLEVRPGFQLGQNRGVSILVVVDQLLEECVRRCFWFQSLLWWISYWRFWSIFRLFIVYTVSILVVVDQLLEVFFFVL